MGLLKFILILVLAYLVTCNVIQRHSLEKSIDCSLQSLRFCDVEKPLLFMIYDSSKMSSFDSKQFSTLVDYLHEEVEYTKARDQSFNYPLFIKINCKQDPLACDYFSPPSIPFILILEPNKNAYQFKGSLIVPQLKSFILIHDPSSSSITEEYPLFGFRINTSEEGFFGFFKKFFSIFLAEENSSTFDSEEEKAPIDAGQPTQPKTQKVKEQIKQKDQFNEEEIKDENSQKKQDGIEWLVRVLGEFLGNIGIPKFLVNIVQTLAYVVLFLLWLVIEIAG